MNSSIGVPITRMTFSARPNIEGDELSSNRPAASICVSSSGAPTSRNGIVPAAIASNVGCEMS